MTRTTRADLDELARVISQATAQEHAIQYAYGQPRLYRAGGSVEVSPRLPAGQMALWMRAFVAGLTAPKSEPVHTIRHEPIGPEGAPYGATHDNDCPACVANGAPWGADPRSEAYWSN